MIKWLATAILLAGLIDDIRSRKVHNVLVIALLVIAVVSVGFIEGKEGLLVGGLALGTSLLVTLPLVLIKALGAGDMKLFAVFAFTLRPDAVLWIVAYSLLWGALLGLAHAAANGTLFSVVKSSLKMAIQAKSPSQVHTVPFTAAMMFGWLTHLSLTGGLRW